MSVLLQTTSVLDMVLNTNDTVTFGHTWWDTSSAEDEYSHRVLIIDRETWDDLGQPQQLTIRVEPGDLLNE